MEKLLGNMNSKTMSPQEFGQNFMHREISKKKVRVLKIQKKERAKFLGKTGKKNLKKIVAMEFYTANKKNIIPAAHWNG